MFELSIAAKYLTPRRRQLSSSLISIISILVIAMVVWLIVVFFSVTNGLTTSWTEKLISLTAPIRITPTEEYYKSYFYQIDAISLHSDYTPKTIKEKLLASLDDPYDSMTDEEIPDSWPIPHRENQALVNPVKKAFEAIQQRNLLASDYELTTANLRIRLLRSATSLQKAHSFLNQAAYLGSLDEKNTLLNKAILPYTAADIGNILKMTTVASDQLKEDTPEKIFKVSPETFKERLHTFFRYASIQALKTGQQGMRFPTSLLPNATSIHVQAVYRNKKLVRIYIPLHTNDSLPPLEDSTYRPAILIKSQSQVELHVEGESKDILPLYTPLILAPGVVLESEINPESISRAMDPSHLRFRIHFLLQGHHVAGEVSLGSLEIAKATLQTSFDEPPSAHLFWLHKVKDVLTLPTSQEMGEGILLPKSFKESGAYIGDGGAIAYYSPTISSLQEQRSPIYVAGFYDPGILPMGGKFLLANPEFTNLIRTSQNMGEALVSNGINVRFEHWDKATSVKQELQKAFDDLGIGTYWKIETYREFEFTKDILQQLDSEKRLFSMLATIIIIVACSNIISMLIILVNDKKLEIGILRSMGAHSVSIACIFGLCGIVMGLSGSLLGTVAAFLTLQNLPALVDIISRLQGYDMFNPVFYGDTLPTDISMEAFLFVMTATILISLASGLIPAIKACMIKPSAILKSE